MEHPLEKCNRDIRKSLLFFLQILWLLLDSAFSFGQINLLCDHSFDSAVNIGGQFPLSGCWIDNHIGQAGAVVDGLHFLSFPFSLHVYTGVSSSDSLSRPDHTVVPINPGFSCHAEAKICTPSGFTWQPGSYAFIRLSFLNSSSQVLSTFDSPLYQNTNPNFQVYGVDCNVPDGSVQAKFSIYLIKPQISGQSIINVDDCILTKNTLPPIIDIEPPNISYGTFNDTIFLRLKNTGGNMLSYTIFIPEVFWLTISPLSGNLLTGEKKYHTLIVNRDSLPPYSCNQVFSYIHILSNASDTINILVSVNTPCGVPDGPSVVSLNSSQLIVEKRLPCNILSPPEPYTIKGFCWSPASVETNSSYMSRKQAFKKWAKYDLGMIKGCNGNTIYTFLDFGLTTTVYEEILDACYENGIMAIVTTDLDGSYDTVNLRNVVNAYKNHPAILMWAVGNEWNINLYHNYFSTLQQAAEGTEIAVQLIKSIDTLHPVATIYGEINIENQSPSTDTIVNLLCPSVDIWGLNIYRGPEFYDLFTVWDTITTKPLFLSEFGIDSYHTTQWNPLPPVGYIDEPEQRAWNDSLWADIQSEFSGIDSSKQCLGGTFFEWNDEYWKVDPVGIQNTGGFYTYWNPSAFPDSFANEEYFGIIGID